ncbi:MAG: hypothetical protein WC393_02860 [Candidatus Nanoarchaeia archaeon]|jgi:glucan phosphoethanolaminetransferase (alkaline phosphatase superfamily)
MENEKINLLSLITFSLIIIIILISLFIPEINTCLKENSTTILILIVFLLVISLMPNLSQIDFLGIRFIKEEIKKTNEKVNKIENKLINYEKTNTKSLLRTTKETTEKFNYNDHENVNISEEVTK